MKTININGKDYVVTASTTKTTLRDDYLTNINTVNGTYITLTKGSLVKDANEGTASLPITVTETIQTVSTADATHKGLAEASDVKGYVDGQISTTIQGLDKANSTVGTNVQVSYEEVDGIVTITNVAGPAADVTSDDAAVATVEVVQTDGKVTDVVVTTNAISVDATNLSVNSTTGAVTGANIANIKSYIDAKAGAANTTINATGKGIVVNSTTGSSDETIYTVNVELAQNAVVGETTTLSQAGNLLKITSDNKLTISDTWDCGTY